MSLFCWGGGLGFSELGLIAGCSRSVPMDARLHASGALGLDAGSGVANCRADMPPMDWPVR